VRAASTAVYCYRRDSRLHAAGRSPYAEPPHLPALATYRDVVIDPQLNRLGWRTIYPSGAQIVIAVIAAPASVLAFNGLVVAADLLTAFYLVGWFGALGRPGTWVLLSPLRLRRSGRPEITQMVEVSV
jgi:hypothetical protein